MVIKLHHPANLFENYEKLCLFKNTCLDVYFKYMLVLVIFKNPKIVLNGGD